MKKFYLLNFLLINSILLWSQQSSQSDDQSLAGRLKIHIGQLASDKMEGRETGSPGEEKAIAYIIDEFKKIGLKPKGKEGFIQPFTFTEGLEFPKEKNQFLISGKNLAINEDYFILPYSSNGSVKGEVINAGCGIVASSINIDDYKNIPSVKGKIALIDLTIHKNFKADSIRLSPFTGIRTRIDAAIEKGAVAILFYCTETKDEPGKFKKSDIAKIAACAVPVIFIKEAAVKTLQDKNELIELKTTINRIEKTGKNVAAFLDNGAKQTIIIGAHLDHLGYGDEENSLHRGSPEIHNGADDNASGTAGVIELARLIKKSDMKNNNYLFLCFSGEEKGLLGSAYFTKNPTIELKNVNCMLNMDMIGRLKQDEKILAVYGTGTSPAWKDILTKSKQDGIEYKQTESGIGPSDHTSFYLKDIPVLHFFSGFHSDYHKPSDDAEKINYDGEASILNTIMNILRETNTIGKLAFNKTKDEAVTSKNTTGRPKTTLGIIPDYNSIGGEGLKIDGVSEGKPAERAGLKAGDIILQIGEYKIADMQSYMAALGNFSKEDKTSVKVKRGTELLNLPVDFSITPETKKYESKLSDKNYRIYSVREGKEISIETVIYEMQNADVLFYGEEHNDSVTHYLEKTIFEKLYTAFGNNLALSMEMFDRDVQNVMNEYLNDYIREKHFKKDARVWSNYRDYRPMVEFAKEKKLDVICANAPSRYSNLAGRSGQKALEKISKEAKQNFAPLPYDTASGKYYEKLTGGMSGHSATDTSKNKVPVMNMGGFNLVNAQSLWDATMAYSISEYRKRNKNKKIFQVNGRFHSDEKFAIVEQLKKYNPKTKTLVISSGSDTDFTKPEWEKLKNQGDFIIVTDPSVPKTYKD